MDALDRLASKSIAPTTPAGGGDALDRLAAKSKPKPAAPAPTFGQRMLRTGEDFASGLGAGAMSTVFHGGDIIRRLTGMHRIIDQPDVQKAMTPPPTTAGRAGKFTEQAAEFAIPDVAGIKAAKGASLLTRAGLEALKAGGVAALQTGAKPRETATAAGLGAALPVAGALGPPALRYASELLGFRTGTGGETIRIAASTASQKFKDAMRNKITEAEIVGDTRTALDKVKEARANEYRRQLANLPQVQLNVVQPVKTDLLRTLRNDYRIGIRRKFIKQPTGVIGPNGAPLMRRVPGPLELDFAHSTIPDAGDQKKILDLVTDLDSWQDNSTLGVDTLKRRIDNLYADTSDARAIVRKTKNQIRSELNRAVPGYQKMTFDYAQASKFIDEINKEFSLKGGTGTVVRKLAYALNQNNQYRKLMIEALGNAAGMDLKEAIAGSAMREAIPRGLVGRAILGGEVLELGHDPHLTAAMLADALASSPRAVGEIMSLISTLRRMPAAQRAVSTGAAAGRAAGLEATQ